MEYATTYDVGDRKREDGINEDSVAVSVFEQGHRDGCRVVDRTAGRGRGSAGSSGGDRAEAGDVVRATSDGPIGG